MTTGSISTMWIVAPEKRKLYMELICWNGIRVSFVYFCLVYKSVKELLFINFFCKLFVLDIHIIIKQVK